LVLEYERIKKEAKRHFISQYKLFNYTVWGKYDYIPYIDSLIDGSKIIINEDSEPTI